MTVRQLCDNLSLRPLCLPDPDREVTGGYAGDMISWVMGGAKEGDAWVTIMSNINVVAVASLSDASCVVLAQNVVLEEREMKTAAEKGVNVLSSSLPEFELCCAIGALIS